MEDSKQGLININEANVEELCTLPGVGESLAERISAARPFEYLEDLDNLYDLLYLYYLFYLLNLGHLDHLLYQHNLLLL